MLHCYHISLVAKCEVSSYMLELGGSFTPTVHAMGNYCLNAI